MFGLAVLSTGWHINTHMYTIVIYLLCPEFQGLFKFLINSLKNICFAYKFKGITSKTSKIFCLKVLRVCLNE